MMCRSAHLVRKCMEVQEKIHLLRCTHYGDAPEAFFEKLSQMAALSDELEYIAISQRQHKIEADLLPEQGK